MTAPSATSTPALGVEPEPPSLFPGQEDVHPDVLDVLVPSEVLQDVVAALARKVDRDYAGKELVLVGVLKGALMVMADLSRALHVDCTYEFMAVSSYGGSTTSSGVVRILKDLDRDVSGKHVLVVEDIVDSGTTLSWLLRNLRARGPASVEVCALLRKPEAARNSALPVKYVGIDLPDAFVVGYGLDYAERYRALPYVATLKPEVYRTS